MKRFLICIAVLCAFYSSILEAAVYVTNGTAPGKYVVEGRIVTPDQVIDGKLVIEGDTIKCVAVSCSEPEGATRIKVSKAFVFPGFIDAHNHVAYNVLPRWSPPKKYQSRGQWQSAKAYKDFKAPYDRAKETLTCEMVKYGEIKALISGVTTIQGAGSNRTCFRTLIRNAENQNELGTSLTHIRTYILDIRSFSGSIDWSKTRSFVVHIGEGLDAAAREELNVLKSKGLLTDKTVIIHGTAFGEPEFGTMAAENAKLVWSPQSNLALYDKTTNIKLARQKGVEISLGVDWNLTGSDNIFEELRVAAAINEDDFDSAIPDSDWVRLITINPARALALDTLIGRLAPNMKADIVVVREREADPNGSILKSRLQDVQLVMVGGDPLYGSAGAMKKLKPGGCEPFTVYGSRKFLCVVDIKDPVLGSDQTLSVIRRRLSEKIPALAPLTP